MAIVSDPTQNNQNGQQDINAPKSVGGGAAGGGGSGYSGGPGSSTAKTTPGGYGGVGASQSGSFQNVSGILNANKDSNIAGGIVNQVGQQANQAETGATNTENTANQNIASQWNAAAGAGNNLQQAQANVLGDVNNAVSGNTAFGTGDQNVQQFQAAALGSYNAPTADWSKVQNQVGNLQQAAQNANSATGQQALLQQYNNNPNYNAGEQQIDQLLLQNNKGEQNTLKGIGTDYAQAASGLTNAQNAVNQNSTTTGNNIQALNQYANSQLNGAIGGYNLNDATQNKGFLGTQANLIPAYQATNAQNFQNFQNQLATNQWNPALAAAGLTQGQNLYGIGGTQLIQDMTPVNNNQTLQNILSGNNVNSVNNLEALATAGNNQGALGSLQQVYGTAPATAGNYQAYTPSLIASDVADQLQNGSNGQGGIANYQNAVSQINLNAFANPTHNAQETADLSQLSSNPAVLSSLIGDVQNNQNWFNGPQNNTGFYSDQTPEIAALQKLQAQYGNVLGTGQ